MSEDRTTAEGIIEFNHGLPENYKLSAKMFARVIFFNCINNFLLILISDIQLFQV